MNLDQRALPVRVELDDTHGIHKDNQAVDEQVSALVLDPLDHVDREDAEHDLRHLKVGRLYLAAFCARARETRGDLE